MQLDIDKEVALLQRITVGQLREKFEVTLGEPTNTRNKQWLVKRITCRAISLTCPTEALIVSLCYQFRYDLPKQTRINWTKLHSRSLTGNSILLN
jgi:hypothetical protein